MLQRGYRAKYTQNKRDFGLLTLRIGGPRLLHAANHAGCAPSTNIDQSRVLYGFCMEHAGVPEIQSESDLLALRRQLEAGTIHRASVCAVWFIVPMHREVSNRDTSWIAFSAINRFCVFFRFISRQRSITGPESEVAHKWVRWLHNPCRLGDPHRFKAGGQNHKWPTSGQGDYMTLAAWGIPTASEQGGCIRGGPQVGKVAT